MKKSSYCIKGLTGDFFLLCLVMGLSCGFLKAQQNTPNIVLFIADDLGWDDVGCYGNEAVATPNMDRIASEGMLFHHVYLTTSSCSPSRSSIITGRYPHNTGAAELHTPLPQGIPVFPELLKSAGYYTGQAGKWHMGEAPRRGFDAVYDKGEIIGDGGEEMWLPTLKERPMDKPFFMWFASLDPHRPWGPNPFGGSNDPEGINPPPYLANGQKTKKDLASYYDEITRFDHYIGLVEEELDRQGVLDNTIIIIVSDNGRPFPRSKTRMYDSGIKTPFIIKWKEGNILPGSACNSLISIIDLAPTILEWAGVSPDPSLQGKSFAHLITQPDQEFRSVVFAEHNWHDHEALERMARTKDFLYVLNLRPSLTNPGPADSNSNPSFEDLKELRENGQLNAAQIDVFISPRPSEELYHYQNDKHQLINVAGMEAYRDQLEDLRALVGQWREETYDSNPHTLTKDWYDRETGEALDVERKRGEMLGGKMATSTPNKGPF